MNKIFKCILNQIVLPVIRLYSNEKMKFPNGHMMRLALAYKILDIMLLISYRIGPEQTRIEMSHIFRIYFSGFDQVKYVKSPVVTNSNVDVTTKLSLSRSTIKARTSIVSFDQAASSRRFGSATAESNSTTSNPNK